jgi:hypothetical protein
MIDRRRREFDFALAYAVNYSRRAQRSRKGLTFDVLESDVLVALVRATTAGALGEGRADPSDVASIVALTRPALMSSEHTTASDMAAVVWTDAARAYQLAEPPAPQLEHVVMRGATARSSHGLLRGLWRGLACAVAMPVVRPPHRARTAEQLERWVAYALGKVVLVVEPRPLSEAGRAAYLLGRLAAAHPDPAIADAAARAVAPVLDAVTAGGDVREPGGASPTSAHIAQVALAAGANGYGRVRDAVLTRMLDERGDAERRLVRKEPGGGYELSPWVPLALASSEVSS